MKVNELQPKQGKVDIELDVLDVGDVRTFEKFGKQGRVANAVAKDDTGDIKISLWNDDIDKIKAGDKIKITNGFVSEWQGELQLSTGRYGQLEVTGQHDQKPASTDGAPEDKPPQPEEDVI